MRRRRERERKEKDRINVSFQRIRNNSEYLEREITGSPACPASSYELLPNSFGTSSNCATFPASIAGGNLYVACSPWMLKEKKEREGEGKKKKEGKKVEQKLLLAYLWNFLPRSGPFTARKINKARTKCHETLFGTDASCNQAACSPSPSLFLIRSHGKLMPGNEWNTTHVARTFTKWRGTSCVKRPVLLLLLLHGSVARTDKPLAINSIILVPAPTYIIRSIRVARDILRYTWKKILRFSRKRNRKDFSFSPSLRTFFRDSRDARPFSLGRWLNIFRWRVPFTLHSLEIPEFPEHLHPNSWPRHPLLLILSFRATHDETRRDETSFHLVVISTDFTGFSCEPKEKYSTEWSDTARVERTRVWKNNIALFKESKR